jgi:hypothetical protein
VLVAAAPEVVFQQPQAHEPWCEWRLRIEDGVVTSAAATTLEGRDEVRAKLKARGARILADDSIEVRDYRALRKAVDG